MDPHGQVGAAHAQHVLAAPSGVNNRRAVGVCLGASAVDDDHPPGYRAPPLTPQNTRHFNSACDGSRKGRGGATGSGAHVPEAGRRARAYGQDRCKTKRRRDGRIRPRIGPIVEYFGLKRNDGAGWQRKT